MLMDVKIINVLGDTTSAMRCYLSGATSERFNVLDNIMMRPMKFFIEEFLRCRISSSYAWMHFLECSSSVAYRLNVKNVKLKKIFVHKFCKKLKLCKSFALNGNFQLFPYHIGIQRPEKTPIYVISKQSVIFYIYNQLYCEIN